MDLKKILEHQLNNLYELSKKIAYMKRHTKESKSDTIDLLTKSRQKLKNEITMIRKMILYKNRIKMTDEDIKFLLKKLNSYVYNYSNQ